MTAVVSVIMPVYNSAKTLLESVSTVQCQTYDNWELLLVDDASKDESPHLMSVLAQQDTRIRTIFLNRNSGAALARNAGVQCASGRYVAFLDSDDLWHPEKLAKQLSIMESSGVAISYTDYEWINENGEPLGIFRRGPDIASYDCLLKGNEIGLSTAVIDQEQTGAPLMAPYRLNHDYALWLKLVREGHKAIRIPESLAQYRRLPGSLSGNKVESALTNFKILFHSEKQPILRTAFYIIRWGLRSMLLRLHKPLNENHQSSRNT